MHLGAFALESEASNAEEHKQTRGRFRDRDPLAIASAEERARDEAIARTEVDAFSTISLPLDANAPEAVKHLNVKIA